MSSYTGKFIAIDGIDGSGKTTQIQMIQDYLHAHHIFYHHTSEPSKGDVGVLLRKYLKDPTVPHELDALLFAADRVHHYYTEILPHLQKGSVVVTDRYVSSSIAYQTAQGLDTGWVETINKFAPPADVTFFLDISPEDAMNRVMRNRSAGDLEKFETLPFQQAVYSAYQMWCHQHVDERVILVDANVDPISLRNTLLRHLHRLYPDVFKYGIA